MVRGTLLTERSTKFTLGKQYMADYMFVQKIGRFFLNILMHVYVIFYFDILVCCLVTVHPAICDHSQDLLFLPDYTRATYSQYRMA